MEEIEIPLEKVQEHIHEAAHHSHDIWIGQIAMFSAIVAVLAAITGLLAGHHSNEALISQIKASDSWNYYQAKGIKSVILQNKQMTSEADKTKIEEYKKEQEEISEKARELEKESAAHLSKHETQARAVTLFQVAIAIAAITVLTRRRRFFYISIGFSLFAVVFLIQSLF